MIWPSRPANAIRSPRGENAKHVASLRGPPTNLLGAPPPMSTMFFTFGFLTATRGAIMAPSLRPISVRSSLSTSSCSMSVRRLLDVTLQSLNSLVENHLHVRSHPFQTDTSLVIPENCKTPL